MKYTIKNSLAALLLLAMGVVGCSKENVVSDNQDLINSTNPTNTADIPMNIAVADEGYMDSDSRTRASENGYLTTFTNGDKIGIYMVEDGVITKNNVSFTYNGEDWTGGDIYYDKKAKYFAYYPYQNDLNGDLKLDASTATEFFGGVISAWTPNPDQESYAKYTSQDLMVANGIVTQNGGKNTLTLGMIHTMGLVVIEMPTKVYRFNNANPIPEYRVPVPNTKFYDFIPYKTSLDTYRLLVRPNQSDAGNLVGSYTGMDGKTKEYRVSKNGIGAAKYKHTKVDGGIIQITHNLQAGDYYLNDGSLIGKEIKLSAQQKAACVGVVYWVGNPALKDRTLKTDRPECVHGLVVAISGDVISTWQSSSTSVQDWLNIRQKDNFLSVQTGTGATDPLNNIQGYNNTKAIEVYNAANSSTNYRIHAVQHVVDYRKTVPAPAISSDWYLPSAKELMLLCGKDTGNIWTNNTVGVANRNLINQNLSLIGAQQLGTNFYWSSSEFDSSEAFFVSFKGGSLAKHFKAFAYKDWCNVRSILAF